MIAWVQGDGASTQIVTAQLWRPPGGFAPITRPATCGPRARSSPGRPPVSNGARSPTRSASTGPRSRRRLDLAATSRAQRWPAHLAGDGRQPSRRRDRRPAGAAVRRPGRPDAQLQRRGTMRARSRLRLRARYADLPPSGLPPADASGISAATRRLGRWHARNVAGRGHPPTRRPGRYRVTVSVSDRAGNVTTLTRTLTHRRAPERQAPAAQVAAMSAPSAHSPPPEAGSCSGPGPC